MYIIIFIILFIVVVIVVIVVVVVVVVCMQVRRRGLLDLPYPTVLLLFHTLQHSLSNWVEYGCWAFQGRAFAFAFAWLKAVGCVDGTGWDGMGLLGWEVYKYIPR